MRDSKSGQPTQVHKIWSAPRPMKSILGALAILSIFLLSNEALTTSDRFQARQFKFAIDTTDSSRFGFEPGAAGPGTGPKSITLGKECAYIVDDFHANVKRIDLKTGNMIASERISSRIYPWPVDAIECEANILVSDSFDSVFVFETSLARLCAVHVGERGERCFLRTTDGGVLLYDILHHAVRSISCQGELGIPRDTVFPQGIAHGMPFSVVEKPLQSVLKTEYFDLPLAKGTESIYQAIHYLDANFLDFDSTRVAYFNVNDSHLVLYYYERQAR